MFTGPDYDGGSLLNLVAEVERRLVGDAPHPGLHPELAAGIPEASSYVVALFDGLGDGQLGHPAADPFRDHRIGSIDAPFPTTTTVSLATVATGRSPAEHGLLGYQLWLPEADLVVNTIKWLTQWGQPVVWDHPRFLPAPNLWERLKDGGAEPITVQPMGFSGSPLSRTLYRGCRFEPWADEAEAVRATVELAREPGRLIFLYVPHVDFAAHMTGQLDPAYDTAMETAARIWEQVALSLPDGAVAIATADHGHVDVTPDHRHPLPKALHDSHEFGGDPRAVFVYGDLTELPDDLPATIVPRAEMETWWGPGVRHPSFEGRAPDGVIMCDEGHTVLHRHADERLIGQHGGLSEAERRIPVIVAS